MMENAVQRVIGLMRVLKDALEANIKQAHAATIINRFMVDQDGKTPMEKPMTKYNKGNKLDVRWQCGLFMGVATRSR